LGTKEEIKNLREEIKELEDHVLHQYHIIAEALRDDTKQVVAEGVMDLNENFLLFCSLPGPRLSSILLSRRFHSSHSLGLN